MWVWLCWCPCYKALRMKIWRWHLPSIKKGGFSKLAQEPAGSAKCHHHYATFQTSGYIHQDWHRYERLWVRLGLPISVRVTTLHVPSPGFCPQHWKGRKAGCLSTLAYLSKGHSVSTECHSLAEEIVKRRWRHFSLTPQQLPDKLSQAQRLQQCSCI